VSRLVREGGFVPASSDEDELLDDAPAAEPESWMMKFAALVPTLGVDDDIRELDGLIEGVEIGYHGKPEVDLNERLFSGVYDVPPTAVSR
jgi:hypothetical protein